MVKAAIPEPEADSETPPAPAMRECDVCRDPIRVDARKCLRCDSYQGWRSYVGFNTTVLSLLVALVSSTATLLPVISRVAQRDFSNVTVRVGHRVEKGAIPVLFF